MISLLVLSLSLSADPAPRRTLTLEEALHTAADNQPTLREAHANTEAADARADEAFGPNLPQVNLTAGWRIATHKGNTINAASAGGSTLAASTGSQLWTGGLTVDQLIWDFQQTWGRYKAAQATAQAQLHTEQASAVTVAQSVRNAYFTARAQKDLVDVARSTLDNQKAHLSQTQGFVQAGTQPEIALAQSKANVANAQVQVITAQNNYATAKARLNQAMGVEHVPPYDVVDTALPAIEGEDGPLDPLVEQAYRARPESAAYESQLAAQDFTVRAIRGGYWPSFGAEVGATVNGPTLGSLQPNVNGQLTLNWNLYSGGQTRAQVREAESQKILIEAERDAFKLQVRLDVEQAQLSVQAAKETLAAAEEAYAAAQAQLTLAEGRYQAGVGNIIELSDAQAGLTSAAAQRVSAVYGVATARANLMAALGLP